MNRADPWQLRCSTVFLDDVSAALYGGCVRLVTDASCPQDVIGAVHDRMVAERWNIVRVQDREDDQAPVELLAEPFGVPATLISLLAPSLQHHAALVDLREAPPSRLAPWETFLERFVQRRAEEDVGLSVLVVVGNDGVAPPLRCVPWKARVRKADAGLWADLHALTDRPEPLGSLVHAIAVEVMGWRLDLAAEFMLAGQQDVLDPVGWLDRRTEPAHEVTIEFNGRPMACPLTLNRSGQRDTLGNRLWRAHLAAIFPWVEEMRQEVLRDHAAALELGDLHRDKFGLTDVRELEISEIVRQIRAKSLVTRDIQEALNALANIRKDLAHRKPAAAADLQVALRLI